MLWIVHAFGISLLNRLPKLIKLSLDLTVHILNGLEGLIDLESRSILVKYGK